MIIYIFDAVPAYMQPVNQRHTLFKSYTLIIQINIVQWNQIPILSNGGSQDECPITS